IGPTMTRTAATSKRSIQFRAQKRASPPAVRRTTPKLYGTPGEIGRYDRLVRRVSPDFAQLSLQLVGLVAQPGGLLAAEGGGRSLHLIGELLDHPTELVAGQVERVAHGCAGPATAASPPPARGRRLAAVARPDHFEDVGDLLAHGLRIDAVLFVVRELALAT